ncbi:MAG: hypothetical protein PHF29_10335 [Candidatus Riflebacteria bacterium]|nr:hypothetical protein [Candidatus Riflebacteria bacterium]
MINSAVNGFNIKRKRLTGLVLLLGMLFVAGSLLARGLTHSIAPATKMPGFFLTEIGELQVIMPESGKSKHIIVAVEKNADTKALSSCLRGMFGARRSVRQKPEPLVAQNKYEEGLVAMFPELQLLTINTFLPQHIQERFNRKLDFGGPNCFNTALAATDGIDRQETRHVSLNEFKARLGLLYSEIQTKTPEPGDVILYNSSDHGAVYLGGDRVFHKKDLHKEYYFRTPKILEVFFPDPGEWVPGPNYNGPYSTPGDTKVRKMQIFRRNAAPLQSWNDAIKVRPEYPAIALMKSTVMKVAPAWSIGKVMGYWSEVLTEELAGKLRETMNSDAAGRFLYTELESVRDQIFITIEDNYFTSPYANGDKIAREIWFTDNEYARGLITALRDSFGLQTDEETLNSICVSLKAINGDYRGKSLLAIIKAGK